MLWVPEASTVDALSIARTCGRVLNLRDSQANSNIAARREVQSLSESREGHRSATTQCCSAAVLWRRCSINILIYYRRCGSRNFRRSSYLSVAPAEPWYALVRLRISFLGVGATISRSVFQDYFIQENEEGSEMWQSFGWNLSAADAYGPW
jgi:hypothetical protein